MTLINAIRPSHVGLYGRKGLDQAAARRIGARQCAHPECNASTHNRKAFCKSHVTDQPYVRAVMARQGELEAELRAAKRGPVDPDGLLANEILCLIYGHDGAHMQEIRADLFRTAHTDLLAKILRSLQRAGKVVIEGCVYTLAEGVRPMTRPLNVQAA